uniref:Uncharacterized protein n=1 Tax=Percolomonas cosmopolitus TaxID=63605 RepID=A0A7S1KRE1_9EUKA
MNPFADPNNPTDAERVSVLLDEHRLKRRRIDNNDVQDNEILEMNRHANTARQGIHGVDALTVRMDALERNMLLLPTRLRNAMNPTELTAIRLQGNIPPHFPNGKLKLTAFMMLNHNALVAICHFYGLQAANDAERRRVIAEHLGFADHLP